MPDTRYSMPGGMYKPSKSPVKEPYADFLKLTEKTRQLAIRREAEALAKTIKLELALEKTKQLEIRKEMMRSTDLTRRKIALESTKVAELKATATHDESLAKKRVALYNVQSEALKLEQIKAKEHLESVKHSLKMQQMAYASEKKKSSTPVAESSVDKSRDNLRHLGRMLAIPAFMAKDAVNTTKFGKFVNNSVGKGSSLLDKGKAIIGNNIVGDSGREDIKAIGSVMKAVFGVGKDVFNVVKDDATKIAKAFQHTLGIAKKIAVPFLKVAGMIGAGATAVVTGISKGIKSVADIVGKILSKVQIVTDLIELAIQPFFLMLTLMFVPVFKAVAPMIKDVFSWVTENKDRITEVGEKMVKIIKDIFDGTIADDMIAIMNGVLSLIESIMESISKYSSGFKDDPFGTIVMIIGDLFLKALDAIANLLQSEKGQEGFKKLVDSFGNALFKVLPETIDKIKESEEWKRFTDALKERLDVIWEDIKKWWDETAYPAIKKWIENTLIPDITKAIFGISTKTEDGVQREFVPSMATIATLISGGIMAMSAPLMPAVLSFGIIAEKCGIDVGAALQGIADTVYTVADTVFKSVLLLAQGDITGAITNLGDGLSNACSKAWGIISDAGGKIVSGMNSLFTDSISFTATVWATIVEGAVGLLTNIAQTISTTVGSIWETITGFVADVTNSVYTAITNLWNSIKTAVSNFVSNPIGTIGSVFTGSGTTTSTSHTDTTTNNYYMEAGKTPDANTLVNNFTNNTLIRYNLSGR